jgi:integrase
MKFSTATIAKLELPAGKTDHFEWDETLPGFGVRLRGAVKRWVVQYRVGPQQRRESLGDVRKVTLEDARKIARNRFAQVELGTDPAADRARSRAEAVAARLTFAIVVDRYMAAKQDGMAESTSRAANRYFRVHFKPLHTMPLGEIKRADVAAELQRLTREHGRTSASRARAYLSALFTWAMKEGLCEANPVVATNDPGAGIKARDRVLSDAELRAIWRACEDDDFGRIVRLLALTGCRRDEIGSLEWSWIDLDTGRLKIPGTHTKNRRTHELPLPPTAIDILRSAPVRPGRRFVFGERGQAYSAWGYRKMQIDTRIAAAGKSMAPWVLHDLRRTMRTGLGKIGVAPHIAELVINHVRGGVEAIYDRHRYEPEIKAALAAWADHVLGLVRGGH